MKQLRIVPFCLVLLLLMPLSYAQFGKNELKQARKLYGKTPVYLRIDIPCRYGKHMFGSYVDPLVNVTPTSANMAGELESDSGVFAMDNVFWGFGPNNRMKITDMGIEDGKIWISLEGDAVEEDAEEWLKNEEAILNFVDIKSTEDFKAAYDRAFSTVPLQDEDPNWSPEVKKAVVRKTVVKGMTKKQAFCVVGAPMSVTTTEENGKKVELWIPRQNNGTHVRWSAWKAGGTQSSRMSGFPSTLKFVDGLLEDIGPVAQSGQSLDLK